MGRSRAPRCPRRGPSASALNAAAGRPCLSFDRHNVSTLQPVANTLFLVGIQICRLTTSQSISEKIHLPVGGCAVQSLRVSATFHMVKIRCPKSRNERVGFYDGIFLMPDTKLARLLAYVTGLVNQTLLLQNEYSSPKIGSRGAQLLCWPYASFRSRAIHSR